jgi:hypothetical protein
MAIALSCSAGGPCTTAVGDPYINPAGSTPGRSGQTLSAAIGTGTVTATVTKVVDTTFGNAIGVDQGTTQRSATAKWGALGQARGTFPITVAICGVKDAVEGQVITLYSDDAIGCGNGPGQFGFVNGGCSDTGITLDYNSYLTVAQGNSFQTKTGCSDAAFNAAFLNKDVLVPIWDTHAGNQYHVTTFAQLTLTAWSANGNADSGVPFVDDGVHVLPPPNKNPKNCPVQNGHDDSSGACIQGVLHGFTTVAGTVNPGVVCFSNNIACFVYLDH